MENHKMLMMVSLGESLRTLMDRELFEKITIKQICNETGVIRATFYNYFDDKYDCLNWIVYHDIVENSRKNIILGNLDQVLTDTLTTVSQNKRFYRTAYQVTVQNSFEDMLRDNISKLVLDYIVRHRKQNYLGMYDDEFLSRYYAESIAFCLKTLIFDGSNQKTVDDYAKMIHDLLGHSIYDFVIR